MDFRKRTLKVRGVEVEFDADDSLPITDLSDDMSRVSSEMGFWGSVHAAAVSEKIECDAFYRSWRAQKSEAYMKANPKDAEWKVKTAVEADPEFLALKRAIAAAEENEVFAKAVFESFAKKGNMLQSKGAMARGELNAQGMTTPAVVPPVSEVPTVPPPRVRKVSNGSNPDGEKKSVVRAATHLRELNRGRKAAEV